ncbi:MAG TPA: tetratricopeptide repeat protein [Chthoniobacterales bacterium]|nr:tetratricopeptide repeat protein [Chthoniobacterales bacterium]
MRRKNEVKIDNFLAELKRRNVYNVAIAYAVGGWALSQGVAQVFPVFDVPNWVIRLIVLLIIMGLPVSLVLAWMFEITPEGIKRTEDVDQTKPHTVHGAWIYIAIVGLLISVALFFLGRYSATPQPREAATKKSIAVLPLLNESGDPHDEYFSDGLSEELIAALGQISGLKVIGRSSSFKFKDRKEEPKVIGQKLGVNTLLEGTVRKQGDRVRVVAALVNAGDGITLWTRTFDRELKDIFGLQEEIARAVADSLKVTLLGANETSMQAAALSNVEAHNAYLQAHFHFLRRNVEAYRQALIYFSEAIRLDPNYALAYAERAEAWTLLGDLTGERATNYAKARADAETAVAIAPSLAEAHAALGWVRFFVEWKFAEGFQELQRAKQLSPANPTANDLLGRVIAYVGRIDDAERQVRYAAEIDPLSVSVHFNLARVLFNAGKLDEAEAAGRKIVELQPTASSSHRFQTLAAVQRGDGEAALREANLEPDENFHRFELALAHYIRGEFKEADAALVDLIAHAHDRLAYQIAETYALRGEKDKAFEWLQTSLDQHDGGMLSLLVDPMLRDLRTDPRYQTLVAKFGMPAAR